MSWGLTAQAETIGLRHRLVLGYCESMEKTKNIDPFVCNKPAVEVTLATSRILKQRMKTADEGRLVTAEKARQQIRQWLSRSSTTKTHLAVWKKSSTGRER